MASFTFEQLVKNYSNLITKSICEQLPWYTKRHHIVEDIHQEVLLSLFKDYQAGKLDPCEQYENKLESMSCIVKLHAKRTAIDFFEALSQNSNVVLNNATSGGLDIYNMQLADPSQGPADDRVEQLDEMLKPYSTQVNSIVDMRRRGLQFKEIARIMGMTEAAAKMLMQRTITNLRKTALAADED